MPDGGEMDAYVALPESGRGPGVLVLMEIFGVGSYIRRAAERLAELGYVGLAPDLYRRVEPGLALAHDEEGLKRGFAAVSQLDLDGAVQDAITALGHLRELGEVDGPVAVLGFCLGGHARVCGRSGLTVPTPWSPTTARAWPEALGEGERISCPVLFHFGAEDAYIPLEQADRVPGRGSHRPRLGVPHPARRGVMPSTTTTPDMFYRPEAAARAWQLTSEFLARQLGREATPAA